MDARASSGLETFRDVYESHSRSLLRLAFLLTGSADTSQDVVHDVFARVGHRLAGIEDPVPYLRRCVINEVRSRHRRSVLAQRHARDGDVDAVDDHELAELRDVLLRLPTRQRAAIVLRYLYQLPETDIADALGCRPSTVRTLVKRGLAQLRRELS